MNVLINSAFASTAADANASTAAAGSGMPQIIILVGFVLIFYLLLWRPQAKRAKEQRQLLSALVVGDEVNTSGGIAGKIAEIKDNWLQLEIASGVKIAVQKQSISGVLPKGTLKI